MGLFRAFRQGFPTHPGNPASSYGAMHPDHINCGPMRGMPQFEGGDQFAVVTALNLGLNAGHSGHFTSAGVVGNVQSLNSSAAGEFSPNSTMPAGWRLLSPATADGWYSLRGVVGSNNVAGGVDQDYVVAGVCRVAMPATRTTREAFWFGWVGDAVSRVAHTSAIPASGTVAMGIMSTATGFQGMAQGATAFAGGATSLGTFAENGIVDDRYFTLGFRAKYSQTAAKCSGEWWINGIRTPVPAANLASFVTTNDARGMISLSSKDGAAANVKVLGAKVVVAYDYLQMYGI